MSPLLAEMMVTVEGRGIDIRSLEVGQPLYPTGTSHKFAGYKNSPHMVGEISDALKSKDYATIPVIPDDRRKDYAMTRLKGDSTGELTIGLANPRFEHPTWKRIPGVFKTRTATYYRYRHTYPEANQWVSLPPASPETGNLPIIAYGKPGHIRFGNPLRVPGTVIVGETDYPGSQAVFNPSMIILPNGDYLANCSMRGHCPTHRSSDKGRTWSLVSDPPLPISFQSLFEHEGNLYLLGKAWRDKQAPVDGRTAVLYQSTDQGATWSAPVHLPFEMAGGHGHDSAPSRMLRHGDRLIRAVQVRTGDQWGPGFISVDVHSDLTDPSNWSVANGVIPSTRWHPTAGASLKVMDEGDTLRTRHGRIVNLAKTQYLPRQPTTPVPTGGAAKVSYISPTEATFDPTTDFVDLPGGNSKFSIRYDTVSDKYWALTSMGRNRCELHLFSSRNLTDFTFEQKVLVGRSDHFDGHNYPFMHIDGDDIVFVLRHAHEGERGQPQRWHDANYLTFHRIPGFRSRP